MYCMSTSKSTSMSSVILMSFFQVACQYENMRIYVTDDYNDNNNDEVDVDNNSQVNLHSPLTVHVRPANMGSSWVVCKLLKRPNTQLDKRGWMGQGSNANTTCNSKMLWTNQQFDQHSKAECHMSERPTIHSNYGQVVLSSTLDFSLVFTLDGLPELGSSFKEIFLVALFEKNPKLIIFHSILHPDSRGLLENLFR